MVGSLPGGAAEQGHRLSCFPLFLEEKGKPQASRVGRQQGATHWPTQGLLAGQKSLPGVGLFLPGLRVVGTETEE